MTEFCLVVGIGLLYYLPFLALSLGVILLGNLLYHCGFWIVWRLKGRRISARQYWDQLELHRNIETWRPVVTYGYFIGYFCLSTLGFLMVSPEPPQILQSTATSCDLFANPLLDTPRSQQEKHPEDRIPLEGSARRPASAWSQYVNLKSNRTYALEFKVQQTQSRNGTLLAGVTGAAIDLAPLPQNHWEQRELILRTPILSSGTPTAAACTPYEFNGQAEISGMHLFPAVPAYRCLGTFPRGTPLLLGRGELLSGRRYAFSTDFESVHSNDHRPLFHFHGAEFQTRRWTFKDPGMVVYKFAIPGTRFLNGECRVSCQYHTQGSGLLEVANEKVGWQPLARIDQPMEQTFALPASLFPAKFILVRIANPGQSSFHVNGLSFSGDLKAEGGEPIPEGQGQTWYARLERQRAGAGNAVPCALSFQEDFDAGRLTLRVDPAEKHQPGTVVLDAAGQALVRQQCRLGLPLFFHCPLQRSQARLELQFGEKSDLLSLPLAVPEFQRLNYGELLAADPSAPTVWWCSSGYKVPRDRPPPNAKGNRRQPMRLEAARNETESLQLILHNNQAQALASVSVSELSSNTGGIIGRQQIRLLQARYLQVRTPSDSQGWVGWCPDPLPPLENPVVLEPSQNVPVWIQVRIPADAVPGLYRGSVTVETENWRRNFPLELQVRKFALPEQPLIDSAVGFDQVLAFAYHGARNEADQRQVLAMYHQLLAEHRLAPINPVPLDPIRATFDPKADPPRALLDFSSFDQALERVLATYHFRRFMIPIQGLGGGSVYERTPPELAGTREGSLEYQAMMSSQLLQLRRHLQERGRLAQAYAYWFDEPAAADYDFVRNGMAKISRDAPGLDRLLTKQPGDPRLDGAADLWCPLTSLYDPEQATPRLTAGERFWWYLCTDSRAPYTTLFIDHPATEPRVWLWQAWQHRITGILCWQSNHWTSRPLFAPGFQNPYADPMSYGALPGQAAGQRLLWGNGDGRLLYPPPAAAQPGANAILAPPVTSIRLEALRDGIEDYEYLALLRQLVGQRRSSLPSSQVDRYEALLAVPAEISETPTRFTSGPDPILKRREAIANAIETLL